MNTELKELEARFNFMVAQMDAKYATQFTRMAGLLTEASELLYDMGEILVEYDDRIRELAKRNV